MGWFTRDAPETARKKAEAARAKILDQLQGAIQNHSISAIGNTLTGQWLRVEGLPKPVVTQEALENLSRETVAFYVAVAWDAYRAKVALTTDKADHLLKALAGCDWSKWKLKWDHDLGAELCRKLCQWQGWPSYAGPVAVYNSVMQFGLDVVKRLPDGIPPGLAERLANGELVEGNIPSYLCFYRAWNPIAVLSACSWNDLVREVYPMWELSSAAVTPLAVLSRKLPRDWT